MTLEALVAGHRSLLLTRSELLAGLTELLSVSPAELDAARQLLRQEPELAAAFETWLDDLKFHPQLLSRGRLIVPSTELLARLGPLTVHADSPAVTAVLVAHGPLDISSLVGAQARLGGAGEERDWSTAIQVIARRVAGAADPEVIVLLSFADKDAPTERAVQQDRIRLFQDGVEIGHAVPSRKVASKASPRELDDEFLPDVEAA